MLTRRGLFKTIAGGAVAVLCGRGGADGPTEMSATTPTTADSSEYSHLTWTCSNNGRLYTYVYNSDGSVGSVEAYKDVLGTLGETA